MTMDLRDAPVLRFDSVDSTNDLARRLASDPDRPPSLPLVLRADRQSKGRGRGSNAWWSDAGSLTFSVLLDPSALGLEDRRVPLTSLATGVAVAEAIRPWVSDSPIGLRWPNDVEVDGRKVAGILPELINGPAGPRLIIGIGLNVRSRLAEAPAEVRRMAGALDEFGPRPLTDDDQEAVFAALLDQLGDALGRLARPDPGLARRWAELDQLLGRPVRVDLGDRIVEGIGRGIDERGGLRLDDGREERTLFGGRVLRGG